MKINTLTIQGFGRLKDLSIEFSDGLTVLLGNNEAGKSTIAAALRAGLYGLDPTGQGRSKKVDWTRWKPWSGSDYGVVITYTLSNGESYRVSRDLTTHRHPAQVYRIGGGDVTDQFRVHSRVMPAFFHLGLTEEAFLATACLSEGSLPYTSASLSAPARPEEIHDALQRLTDSSGNTTAKQAQALLEKALEELGTERAATKPLRKAEDRLEGLLTRQAAALDGFEKLARLEEEAAKTAAAHAKAQEEAARIRREWLLGKLTGLEATRARIATLNEQISGLNSTIGSHVQYEPFPAEIEGDLLQAVGELSRAEQDLEERRKAWEEAAPRLEAARKRCREIASERSAMVDLPVPADRCAERERRLQAELNEVVASTSSLPAAPDSSRADTLLAEIAATGLKTVPREFFPELPALIGQATVRGYLQSLRAGALLGSLGIAGLVITAVSSKGFLILPSLLLIALAIVLCGLGLIQFAPARAARKKIAQNCPGLDVLPGSLEQLERKIPDVLRLYRALDEEQQQRGRETQQSTDVLERLALITGRCEQLARESGVGMDSQEGSVGTSPPVRAVDWETPAGMIRRANAALEAVQTLLDQHAALSHLELEEKQQKDAEAALISQQQQYLAAQDATRALRTAVTGRIARTGIVIDGNDQAAVRMAVDELTAATAGKKVLLRAQTERAALQATLGPLGSEEELSQQISGFKQFGVSEGLLADADDVRDIDMAPLQLDEVERSGAAAMNAAHQLDDSYKRLRAEADALRAQLPERNSLEEEIAEAREQVEQLQRRKAALELGCEILDLVARRVHRAVAPQLGSYLGERLELLTEGRYSECTVDEQTFEVSVRPPESLAFTTLDKLSHGTRDQIGLLLRMGLADVFSAEPLPLLLDEPLISADPERRARMAEFLGQASLQQQVVITTTDPRVAELLADSAKLATVVQLPAAAAIATAGSGYLEPAITSIPDPLAPAASGRPGKKLAHATPPEASPQNGHAPQLQPSPQPKVVADIIEEVSRTHPVRRRH